MDNIVSEAADRAKRVVKVVDANEEHSKACVSKSCSHTRHRAQTAPAPSDLSTTAGSSQSDLDEGDSIDERLFAAAQHADSSPLSVVSAGGTSRARSRAHTEHVKGITGVERAEIARGKSLFIEDVGYFVVAKSSSARRGRASLQEDPTLGSAPGSLQSRINLIMSTLPQRVEGNIVWPKDLPLSADAPTQGDMIRRLQIDRIKNHGPQLDAAFQAMWDIAEASGAAGAIAHMEETVARNRLMQHLYVRAFVLLVLHSPKFHDDALHLPELEDCVIFHRWNVLETADETLHWSPPATPSDETLTYFRDDYAFAQHHFLMHHVFYHQGIPTGAGRRCTLERQGEVFFYKHQQMLTRYVAERVSWRLPPLEAYFGLPGQVYPEHDKGWDPPATLRIANESWPFPFVSRPAGVAPKGLDDGTDFDMVNVEKQVAAFMEMIDAGVSPDGKALTLDMLGRMMEQHITGMQWPKKFGLEGVHNAMHDLWSIVGQGPDTTNYGCMGQGLDSARDPIFYHVHTYIDNIRERLIAKHFKPHELPDQHCPLDIRIRDFAIDGDITTTLTAGKFLHERGHLEHSPFEWSFTLYRARPGQAERELTARIFMAPAETCTDHKSWIEMDKFTVILGSQQQEFKRKCTEASVVRLPGDSCGCGFPYNLMVPAGRPEGQEFVCILVVTQNDRDAKPSCCRKMDPIVECASKSGGIYPDKLAMGYPFDRRIVTADSSSGDLLENLSSLVNCQMLRCSVKLDVQC